PLFPSASFASLMQDHLTRVPELAPLDKAEQRVLHRALAKDPRQRYGSCVEFMEELETALAPTPERDGPPPRNWTWIAPAMVLFALIVLLVWRLAFPPSTFSVIRPNPVVLKAGEVQSFPIVVNRTNLAEAVELHFSGLPDLVEITDRNIEGDHNSVNVEAKA